MMEYLVKIGEPGLHQDTLIYGKEYEIFRDGKCLGNAIFSDDKIHGDVFLKTDYKEYPTGVKRQEISVYVEIDQWKLL